MGDGGGPMELDVDSDDDAVASRLEELQEETDKLESAMSGGSSQSQTSTKSISGSFFELVQEHGRTYVDETYLLPTDDNQETNDSIFHQIFASALSGQLTFHRVRSNVSRILDVGANPGDWAIAMAERYPDAEIVATDLVPCDLVGCPPNLLFQIDDAYAEWTYTEPFDFIHIRNMAGAFADWGFIYDQVCKHLGDDGIVELVEKGPIHHNSPVVDSYLDIYNAACQSAADAAGITLGLEHLQRERVEASGLKIFRSVTIEIPIGQWSPDPRQKTLGKLALVGTLERLEAQSMRLLTKFLDWSVQDVTDLCARVRAEILDEDTKPSMTCTFVVARKMPTI